jgi:hypothetical protein
LETEAGFDDQVFRGSLADLARLARPIETKFATASPGSLVLIQEEFAAESPYAVVLDLQAYGFDRAAADPLLPGEEGSI